MEFNATFLVTIVSFVIFVYLMNVILYNPILSIMQKREDLINENYESAEADEKETENLNSQREEKIEEAHEDARVKYNELIGDYKQKRNDIVKGAQINAHNETESAYIELNNVSNEAKEALKSRMTDLANDIVEKVLGYRSEVQGFDNDSINNILYNEKG